MHSNNNKNKVAVRALVKYLAQINLRSITWCDRQTDVAKVRGWAFK